MSRRKEHSNQWNGVDGLILRLSKYLVVEGTLETCGTLDGSLHPLARWAVTVSVEKRFPALRGTFLSCYLTSRVVRVNISSSGGMRSTRLLSAQTIRCIMIDSLTSSFRTFLPSLSILRPSDAGRTAALRPTTPVSVPYYAPTIDLPAPLPTTAEIESSDQVLKDGGVKVVVVGTSFVVKYGKRLDLEEGRMMVFVQQNTQVGVPRVFALYQENGKNFIVMERIHGQTLQSTWHTFSDQKKQETISRLKDYVKEIRNIQSPAGYCCLGNGPLLHSIFASPSDSDHGPFNGPFSSEAQLNDALIRKCRASEGLNKKAEYYERVIPKVLVGHPPVLTHGDLQKKNIMVRKGPTVDIVLLDWESAGWYPSYWEYANTIFASWFEGDWFRWVDDFLEPFPNEYAWYAMLAQEIGY